MSTVAGSGAVAHATEPEVSLFRLYTLRVSYLILSLGLGVEIWPIVIHHTSQAAVAHGIQLSLLAGIGATALLGFRYPVQMLPLLLFELIWKAIYLIAFALPLWSAHEVDAETAEDIQACLMAVIFVPLIPRRYAFAHYVLRRADRWK